MTKPWQLWQHCIPECRLVIWFYTNCCPRVSSVSVQTCLPDYEQWVVSLSSVCPPTPSPQTKNIGPTKILSPNTPKYAHSAEEFGFLLCLNTWQGHSGDNPTSQCLPLPLPSLSPSPPSLLPPPLSPLWVGQWTASSWTFQVAPSSVRRGERERERERDRETPSSSTRTASKQARSDKFLLFYTWGKLDYSDSWTPGFPSLISCTTIINTCCCLLSPFSKTRFFRYASCSSLSSLTGAGTPDTCSIMGERESVCV